MYIKDQTFKDEDTLMEMLFDFSLGEPSVIITEHIAQIDKDLEQNTAYQDYYKSLTDEDDREELYIEERDLRLAEILMAQFTHFEIKASNLYGVANGIKELLFEMNLH